MASPDAATPRELFYPHRSFLPGGLPLHGEYARWGGILYSCRPERRGGTLSAGERVVLTSAGERPGPGWELTPVYRGNPMSEWTKAIDQSEAEELFRCRGTVTWRGTGFTSPAYLPAANHVGGYINHVTREMQPGLEGIHRLERVDQSTWYGYVPLDELEALDIRRLPWPGPEPGAAQQPGTRPNRPRRPPLARLLGAPPGSAG